MADKSFVPRINQLDACTLDTELLNTIRQQISSACKYFTRNPLDWAGPEVHCLVRVGIWWFTVVEKGASVGQDLLGMKYQTRTRDKLYTLALATMGLTYLKERQRVVLQWLPGSEETKNQVLHYSSIITKCLTLINSILFLRQGLYPTLGTWLLGLKQESTTDRARAVGYSYMSRELIWSTFTELLIFLVPLLNSTKLKSKISQKFSSIMGKPASPINLSQCSLCSHPPILPCRGVCGHIFCYYCMATHLATTDRCAVCGADVSEEDIQYIA